MDPPRSLMRIASQNIITPTKVWECFAAISAYFYLGTAWLSVVPDLKTNQTDEGQPSEEEPTQNSDHYDKE